ncbi:MAG TPA: condensation domain-containing protein, partial [Spirochaetales bacterium]|nr:condensation domain-containing protein [Spirochaetales bacterium]
RLERAVASLVASHDALRRSYAGNGPSVRVDPSYCFETVDGDDEAVSRLGSGLHDRLDPASGTLFAARLYRGSSADHVQLSVHHLAVDLVSWNALVSGLARAYLTDGDPGGPGVSFGAWAAGLDRVFSGGEEGPAREYYRRLLQGCAAGGPRLQAGTWGSSRSVRFKIAPGSVERLRAAVAGARGLALRDVLAGAFMAAWADWTGSARVAVDMEGHGRAPMDGLDPSGAVGWFTAIHPVALDTDDCGDWNGLLSALADQFDAAPMGGHAWLALLDRGHVEQASDVLFNYAGDLGASAVPHSQFTVAELDDGPRVDPERRRSHAVDVSLSTGPFGARGELRVPDSLPDDRVQALVEGWQKQLDDFLAWRDAGGQLSRELWTKRNLSRDDARSIKDALAAALGLGDLV